VLHSVEEGQSGAAFRLKTNAAAALAVEPPSTEPIDPVHSAKLAGLRYVTDTAPGFRRRKNGKRFLYLDLEGKIIRDAEVIRRINALAIPPAWRDVWICPLANGHLQATGRDAKRRKQYRYHPHWREVRDQTKYDKMLAFAKQLPAIRRQVEKDLSLPGLPRQKVLATVVRLLETGMVRVGNEEYARQNQSFGLATLRSHHVDVSGPKIKFEFRGKSGVQHSFDLNDHRLAKIIRRCQELPGHELFQYLDENGERCTIDSADVNDYLRTLAGDHFSSKDFRTWTGTVLAATALTEIAAENNHPTKKNITRAIESVAKQLGNTTAVCRKCYIHPAVVESYQSGLLTEVFQPGVTKSKRSTVHGLKPAELSVVALLNRTCGYDKRESLGKKLRRSLQRARNTNRRTQAVK
jgi:DNA topoisomerase I